eukprot:scaffold3.g6309.t1
MIFTTFVAPVAVLIILGPVGAAVNIAMAGMVVGLELGIGLEAGVTGTPEYICTGITAALILAALGLLAWSCIFHKLEAHFDRQPWLEHTRPIRARPGGRAYQTRCPWTGRQPSLRCPSCDARVHAGGWHKGDRLSKWLVGDVVLRWDQAKAAAAMVEDDSDKGRKKMDQAFDYCGNIHTNGVAECCIGCAAWQKWLNLGTRRVITMVFGSFFFCLAPWGFNSAYTSFWGTPLQVVTEVMAVCWATTAVLYQAKNILRTNEFLLQHREAVPSFRPLFELDGRWGGVLRLATWLAHTPWD